MSVQSITASPSSATDHADPNGAFHWQNASGALGGTTPASAPGAGGLTHQLRLTGFDFGVPDGATINGVKVELRRSASQQDSDFLVYDGLYGVRILKGGNVGPDRPAYDLWSVSPEWVVRGGGVDLWGVSLTPADVNGADFGVAVLCGQVSPDGASGSARIHDARITVYYEVP